MTSKYWSESNIGKVINYFTIVGMKEHGGLRGRKVYVCRCCCNKIVEKEPYQLFGNLPHKSCGCMTNKIISDKNKKHGLRNTRLFNIWSKMRQRCNNEEDKLYRYYGGRGIRVCEEWEDFVSFYKWATFNGYTDNLTLERLDVNGNYEPLNCAWKTMKVQCNNKRNNIKITYKGKTQTLKQWCTELEINYKLTYNRIKYRGWSVEKAFSVPATKGDKNDR